LQSRSFEFPNQKKISKLVGNLQNADTNFGNSYSDAHMAKFLSWVIPHRIFCFSIKLELSGNQQAANEIAVSDTTLAYCKSRAEQLKEKITLKQRIGSNLKLWLDHCRKSASFIECMAAKSDVRPPSR
jgi:hypothetical protein